MSILKKLAKRRKKLSDQSKRAPMPAMPVPKGKWKKGKWKMVTEVDGDWQC